MLDEFGERYISRYNVIPLTSIETLILSILIQNKDKVTSRKQLLKLFDDRVSNPLNNLRNHIWYLKEKLKGEIIIMPVYSVGYKIEYIGG
jgi:DNA-binding response OmpR family regulator